MRTMRICMPERYSVKNMQPLCGNKRSHSTPLPSLYFHDFSLQFTSLFTTFQNMDLNTQMLVKINGILLQAMNAMHDTLNDAVHKHDSMDIINNNDISNNFVDNNVDNNIHFDDKNKRQNNNNNSFKKKTGPKSDSAWICFVKHRSSNIKLEQGQKLMKVLAQEWKSLDSNQKKIFFDQALQLKSNKQV